MPRPAAAPAEPFFLDTAAGRRFCLFHAPQGACRGALLYVHPFAEEMNRARRMAALQARAFAARGIGVLLLDLHGCGDSDGDFADAGWDGWLADIDAGRAWLEARLGRTAGLWGLRLGGLLALQAAHRAAQPPEQVLLWQPVTAGLAHLNQFLRLRLAADMLAGGAHGGAEALRACLRAGETIEIAGYGLTEALAGGMERADAAPLSLPCPVHWFELAAEAGRPMPPAAARVASIWQARGARVHQELVQGPPFWSTPEVAEAPALVRASLACFAEAAHA